MELEGFEIVCRKCKSINFASIQIIPNKEINYKCNKCKNTGTFELRGD